MNSTPSPCELKSTLRGHEWSVTSLEYFYIPNAYSQKNELLTSTIISGDEKGNLIWWNLITRRPILKWKAHDGNTLSIRQLGISWELCSSKDCDTDTKESQTGNWSSSSTSTANDRNSQTRKGLKMLQGTDKKRSDFYKPKIGKLFGLLVTHARDNTMKIWDLHEFINKSTNGSLAISGRAKAAEQLEPIYSEPINSLNFCNVDIYDNRLCSLNKLNGDCFDVHIVKHDNCANKCYLEPQFENIDPSILVARYLRSSKGVVKDSEKKKLKKLGIIMKLLWVTEETLYIGFESGHIISVNVPGDRSLTSLKYIDESKIQQLEDMFNADNLKQTYMDAVNGNVEAISHLVYGDTTTDSKIKIVGIDSSLYPNPILDIQYDQKSNKVFVGSTGSELLVLNVCKDEALSILNGIGSDFHALIQLRSVGVSSIAIRLDNLVAVTFWNGQVKFYNLQAQGKTGAEVDTNTSNAADLQNPPLSLDKLPYKIVKRKPQVTKEFSSNPNDPEIQLGEKHLRRFKSSNVRVATVQSLATIAELVARYKPLTVKDLLEYKRFLKSFVDNWVAVGYDDGCVELYQVAGSSV